MPPFSRVLFFLLLFLSLSSIVFSQSSRGTGSAVSPISPDPITPLLVRSSSPNSLVGISTTDASSRAVLAQEASAYATLRREWNESSSVGIPSAELRSFLVESRHRYLMAIHNRLVSIYHRMDYLIQKLNPSLVRMRSVHSQNPHISYFDSRLNSLSVSIASLEKESDALARLLESCPSSVDFSQCVKESRDASSQLLAHLTSYMVEHRELVSLLVSS
ncbi:MAG: hypothetical protein V1776_00400 [Candidatus Diapherotrites archaeon]